MSLHQIKQLLEPSKEVSFKPNIENLNKLKRSINVIHTRFSIRKNNTDVFLTVKDKKNDTTNTVLFQKHLSYHSDLNF